MYNKITIMGRICHDLEIITTQNGVPLLKFRVAVNRRYKTEKEERLSDFFNVVAWRSKAEHIQKYFKKGSMIFIEGYMQSRRYIDKENKEQLIWEILVTDIAFTGEKNKKEETSGNNQINSELTEVYKNQTVDNNEELINDDCNYDDYPF